MSWKKSTNSIRFWIWKAIKFCDTFWLVWFSVSRRRQIRGSWVLFASGGSVQAQSWPVLPKCEIDKVGFHGGVLLFRVGGCSVPRTLWGLPHDGRSPWVTCSQGLVFGIAPAEGRLAAVGWRSWLGGRQSGEGSGASPDRPALKSACMRV